MNIPLNEHEDKIVEHLRRYRVSTPTALQRLCPEDAGTAERATATLIAKNLVAGPFPLFEGQTFYQLTAQAQQEVFAESKPLPLPLQGAALVRAYGFLWHCGLTDAARSRLLPAEFQTKFPHLDRQGLPTGDFFIEQEPEKYLGYLLVDTGRLAKRLAATCYRKQQAFSPEFDAVIEADKFRFTVLVSSVSKQQTLRARLEKPGLAVTCTIHVVPELALLDATQAEDTQADAHEEGEE